MNEASSLTVATPLPAGGESYYREELKKAIAFSDQRKQNYDKYLHWKEHGGDVDFLPVKMDIENVSRCNFKCTMCVVSDWHKGKRAEDMSFEQFKAIIDEQYGLVEIKLQGIGESLMQGDPFFEMIRYARSKSIWVRVTTNASLLHLNDNYKKLIDSDVNEVQISIDGAEAGTFEKIRRGSVFSRVLSNCSLINDYTRQVGVERTKMWTVVQSDNINQVDALVDLASEVGFTNQVFMLDPIGWGIEDWEEHAQNIEVSAKMSAEKCFSLMDRGKNLGVRVAFWISNDRYSSDSMKTLCQWPFERAYIGSDGRVSPCCMIGNPDVFEIGDGVSKGFTRIWNSEGYKEFRQRHIDGRIPTVCRNCYKP